MLSAIRIKEEILDEIGDLQEMFRQEEDLRKQQFFDSTKDELHAESSLPLNNFHIVDEQESIITVSAGDMKSEAELQFIKTLNDTQEDPSKFKGVCTKCLKMFTDRAHFLKHTKRNHCVTKEKCPVCPVTFIDTASLLNHLKLHQENYFFCSQHCGANYKTLPLCEEHEVKEHKTQNPPKIRYKHFCSFCREGFKTELQLHVHWLQQTQGCGKLMQDVIIHSTNVANFNNNKNGKHKNNKNLNNNKVQDQKSNTTNSVTTIPITKLRLKSSVEPMLPANKRMYDQMNDEDINMKRMKMFNQNKDNAESLQLPFNFEEKVQIKEEPLDEEDHNMTSNLIPEVIIKTEEDKTEVTPKADNKPEMKSLFINNMLNPEFNGKIIPLTVHTIPNKMPLLKLFSNNINNNMNNNFNNNIDNNFNNNINNNNAVNNNNYSSTNTSLQNVTNLKLVKFTPASIASSNRNVQNFQFSQMSDNQGKLIPLQLSNTQRINNGNLVPLPKKGLQILKFLPNTQMVTFKTMNQAAATTATPNTVEKKPLVIKLQSAPLQQIFKPSYQTNPPPLVTTTTLKTLLNQSTTTPQPLNNSVVSIKLNSIDHNTTIDTEDLKKLQTEALIKAEEHRKNFVIPKERLMVIENLPEKKQIIDIMKKQIAQVEINSEQQQGGTENIISLSSSSSPKCSADNFVLNDKNVPPSLYLPILSTMDVELVQARYQHPEYVYRWICPYCSKDYDLKKSLQSHLIRAHHLVFRDMEKINVQAKAFKNEELEMEITQQIKNEIIEQDDNDSQSLTSESETMHADSTTSSNPIKMSVFKPRKMRYICNKCGRKCSSKTMLNDHVFAKCSREPQYSCLQCPKKFYSQSTLQCHMSIHTGELPHKCSYCEKRFRTRGQVTVHHRTHTGERPFICQVCSQRFTHRETLIAHLSRHIGMKRYKCYGCDKHFSCISALKTHREIRVDSCGKVKFNPRAIGPRVRVIRGNVVFEAQPEINPYLKSEDPKNILSELQNHQPEMAK